MINTYYTALGIHETATQDEIKSAYRKKVLECHPDRNNGSAESQKLFVAVNQAYIVLSDIDKRTAYDNTLVIIRASERPMVTKEFRACKKETLIIVVIKKALYIISFLAPMIFVSLCVVMCEGDSENVYSSDKDTYVISQGTHNNNTHEKIEWKSLSTGETPYSNKFGQGKYDKNSLSYIEIANGAKSDAVAMLYDVNRNMVYRHVYITANDKYTMKNIPEGLYDLKVYYGNNWNPDKVNGEGFPTGGFLANESFSHSETQDYFDIEFVSTSDGVSYPTITVTLYEVSNGNMETEKISKNDFFN